MDDVFVPPPAQSSAPRPPSGLAWLLGLLCVLLAFLLLPTLVERVLYAVTLGRERAQVEAARGQLPTPALTEISRQFAVVAKAIGPSVVHIDTVQELAQPAFLHGTRILQQAVGQGSGVIIDEDGYILTNNHVVENARQISVKLSGDKTRSAAVVGLDETTDLAVLKIPSGGLIAAEWGDSDTLEVGSLVWAVGNPFGLDRSVTFGIISAKNRRGNSAYQDFLQTDAAVNPGNSGGPLVDVAGQVVGINTAIVGRSYQGVSFSIPASIAKEVYDRLREEGRVVRGYMGVELRELTPELAEELGIESNAGALVAAVEPHTPAETAGVKTGDVVVEWNGQPVADAMELTLMVGKTKVGETVQLKVLRNAEPLVLDLKVEQRPYSWDAKRRSRSTRPGCWANRVSGPTPRVPVARFACLRGRGGAGIIEARAFGIRPIKCDLHTWIWVGERSRALSSGVSYDTKERIKQAIDIVDLVGSYLPLRREGRGFKALCPWHDDTRPSLQVNPERQSFRCWVCDIGGDIFSFIMRMEGVEFPEALRMLADRANISLADAPHSPAPADDKRLLYQAMAWADEQYHRCLLHDSAAQAARDYLAERHVSADSIRRFQLGFAPDDWNWLAEHARGTPYSLPVLERVGLVSRRRQGPGYYDRFKGRVLFPIFDGQSRAVGVGGRVLPQLAGPDMAKYVNSPESPLFSKSKLLYGLNMARDAIRKTSTALVVEGYTDCIAAHQFGFDNCVAVLGTALGTGHVQLLRRYADRVRVILVLDGDEAGRRRAKEVLELFVSANVDLRVLTLPDDADPADYLLAHGADAFGRLADGAPTRWRMPFTRKPRGSICKQTCMHRARPWSGWWPPSPKRPACGPTRWLKIGCAKRSFYKGWPSTSGFPRRRCASW